MKLTDKIRPRLALLRRGAGVDFILNGVVGLLGLKHMGGNPTPSV
ncbi:Uncharacterised protein [Klebsiella pneumoniae]|nr:Uncharacterised protein [Klebsiella pneumoniae]